MVKIRSEIKFAQNGKDITQESLQDFQTASQSILNEIKVMNKQSTKMTRYLTNCMKTLENSINNKSQDNHQIPDQCKNEIDPVNSLISGYKTQVCDPDICEFHTVMMNGNDAGCTEMPGSVLGVTHGIVSEIVSNLITESTQPVKSNELTNLEGLNHDSLSLPIDQPIDESSFDQTKEFDIQFNFMPLEAPWQIVDMPDASQIFEPNLSMGQGRGKYECKRFKLNDQKSQIYQKIKQKLSKDYEKANDQLKRQQSVKEIKGYFVNLKGNELQEIYMESALTPHLDPLDIPCFDDTQPFDQIIHQVEPDAGRWHGRDQIVEDQPIPSPKKLMTNKKDIKQKFESQTSEKGSFEYSFVNENQF